MGIAKAYTWYPRDKGYGLFIFMAYGKTARKLNNEDQKG